MLFEAKSLLNIPIISAQSATSLGFSGDVIIDPENGKVLGLLTSTSFLQEQKALAFSDIYKLRAELIIVKNDESVVEISNIVRMKRIFDQKLFMFGTKVLTESGKKLGKVVDFVINDEPGILAKIYVEKTWGRGLVGETLVIAASQIISITRKEIIVRDDTLKEDVYERETMEEMAAI